MAGVGTIVLAVVFTLLLPVWQRLWQFFRQWVYLRHLPAPPDTHWLLGHAPDFVSTEAPMRLADYARKCGGMYRLRFLYSLGVIITDPTLVRAVLQSSRTYVPKDRLLLSSLEVPCGTPPLPNIVTSSDGDYWRLVRGAWMKCFTSTNLKRVLPILQGICERVVVQIKQQAASGNKATAPAAAPIAAPPTAGGAAVAAQAAAEAGEAGNDVTSAEAVAESAQPPAGSAVVNVCDVMDRITLDVIGHMSYGRDFGAVDHRRSRYLELVSAMLTLMHEEMAHPMSRLLRNIWGGDKKKALLRAEWDATNTAEVMRAVADPPGEHTIAGQLLALKDPVTQQPLSLPQLKSELVIATLAGFETTSNGLSWTLGALAAHPQALATLEQELQGAGLLSGPDNPTPPRFEWQVLGKLPYLQACIREGLRLFAPAPQGSFRLCTTTDIVISKQLTLPKGTPIGIPLYAFGRNAETYGADVDEFKPERWLVGRTTRSMGSMTRASMSSTDDDGGSTAAAGVNGATPAAAGAAGAETTTAAASAGQKVSSSKQQLQDPWTFSIGPRDCAGQALARLELQVVLAAIVGNFKVQLAPEVGGWDGLLSRRMFHTTLQVRGGLPLVLTPRVP